MYIPPHFEETDLATLHDLVEAYPLGTWITAAAGVIEVNHIPFTLDRHRGEFGTLVGHVARSNGAWKTASHAESVVVFQGPEAYISPGWYPAKQEHGKVVPTWNYAVVHAHGTPTIIEDPGWLRRHVSDLTRRHEAGSPTPWHVSDAPSGFIDALLGAIVGLEIPVSRLVGKWKVSQNRSERDREGVVAGLGREPGDRTRRMAELVRHYSEE